MMEFINFHLMPGIILGSIYALGAIGISMTFGILRFANFAHGEYLTLGAYFAFTLVQLTGWHPLAILPFAMILTAAVALGVDRVFYKPFRASPAIMVVIASFGMMLMIRSAIQFSGASSSSPSCRASSAPTSCSMPCGSRPSMC